MLNADTVIEKNYVDLCVQAVIALGGKVVTTPHYSFCFHPENDGSYDWYNRVFSLRLPDHCSAGIIASLADDIAASRAPKRLLVTQETTPKDIQRRLPAAGFLQYNHQTGMLLDLETYSGSSEPDADVVIVNSTQQLREWLLVVDRAFHNNRKLEPFQRLLDQGHITLIALLEDDTIVSTALLFIVNDVGGFHLIATEEQARGKGFGTRITKAALSLARRRGCKTAVLQSSDMGKQLYLKLGFEEHGKLHHWQYEG